MTTEASVPINPLAPAAGGRYEDALVVVERQPVGPGGPLCPDGSEAYAGAARLVHTPHFEVFAGDGRLHVAHTFTAADVDDDLAGIIAEELFAEGWVRGSELFERIFTGVVLTTDSDPQLAWETFYRNSLARIAAELARPDRPTEGGTEAPGPAAHGSIAEYAPVYRRAASLIAGRSVLELGSCFGFFSLLLAEQDGLHVTASDLSAGTVDLLGLMARRLGHPLRAFVADAASVPAPDRVVDTVFVLHLLEHLEPEHGQRVVAEAVRLARERVVIAVPLELEPDEAFGHVRALTLADLRDLGRHSGQHWEVFADHGGWLVLDRLR